MRRALRVVSRSTKEASIARLIKLLEAPNMDVRIAAIQGLETMGAVVAVPDLVELVGSDDEAIKAAALDALERLKETTDRSQGPVRVRWWTAGASSSARGG